MDWFRYHHGTPTDAKLSMVAKKAGARRCEMTALWDCLLDHASQNVKRGFVGDINLEVIAFSQDVALQIVTALHLLLIENNIIKDGFLANWPKRQPKKEDASAVRVRAYRERQNKEKSSTKENYVTEENNNVTTCNAVTPLDKRREDKKERKENTKEVIFIPPENIPSEIWETFMEVRTKKGAVQTPRALRSVVKEIERLKARGHNPVLLVENAIRNGWKDVYEPKNNLFTQDTRPIMQNVKTL